MRKRKKQERGSYETRGNLNLGFTVSVSKNNRIAIPKNIVDVADIAEGNGCKVSLILMAVHEWKADRRAV